MRMASPARTTLARAATSELSAAMRLAVSALPPDGLAADPRHAAASQDDAGNSKDQTATALITPRSHTDSMINLLEASRTRELEGAPAVCRKAPAAERPVDAPAAGRSEQLSHLGFAPPPLQRTVGSRRAVVDTDTVVAGSTPCGLAYSACGSTATVVTGSSASLISELGSTPASTRSCEPWLDKATLRDQDAQSPWRR